MEEKEQELKSILSEIEKVYSEILPNSEKHERLSYLWTKYYQKAKEYNISSEDAYFLYLFGENQSFIIDQKPIRKMINFSLLEKSINHFKEIKENNINEGLSKEEIEVLLDYVVENARGGFTILGINVEKSSLNGFCELGQALSIMPLENLGLKVTKNRAKDAFDYPLNHCFGTVTFPFQIEGEVTEITYLIDTTYRQFFTSIRCNEGRYYTLDENLKIETAPDPGYFIKDIEFAKNLIADGYIELNEKTARVYGQAFDKAGRKESKEKDYYQNILTTSSNYALQVDELEGLNIEFPKTTNKRL